MDLGLVFGFLGVWVLLLWAIIEGGSVEVFLDPIGFLIVFGCAFLAMFVCFPVANLKQTFKIIRRALFYKPQSVAKLIEDMVSYAEIARRDGILSLENTAKDIEDPFIVRGIQMAVDGTDPELIEQIMETELHNLVERHETGKTLFEMLAKYGPAFGMIGTLIGLAIMLTHMDDPTKVGPGMAVALMTTLYGALIANAIAGPFGDRLGRRSAEEVLYKTIIIKGVMSIQSGDNPRIVEQKLRTFLPPSARPPEQEKEAA